MVSHQAQLLVLAILLSVRLHIPSAALGAGASSPLPPTDAFIAPHGIANEADTSALGAGAATVPMPPHLRPQGRVSGVLSRVTRSWPFSMLKSRSTFSASTVTPQLCATTVRLSGALPKALSAQGVATLRGCLGDYVLQPRSQWNGRPAYVLHKAKQSCYLAARRASGGGWQWDVSRSRGGEPLLGLLEKDARVFRRPVWTAFDLHQAHEGSGSALSSTMLAALGFARRRMPAKGVRAVCTTAAPTPVPTATPSQAPTPAHTLLPRACARLQVSILARTHLGRVIDNDATGGAVHTSDACRGWFTLVPLAVWWGKVSGTGGMPQLAEGKRPVYRVETHAVGDCWLYERAGEWCLSRSLSATAPCTLANPNPDRVLLPQALPQRRWRHFRADAAADVRIRCRGTPAPTPAHAASCTSLRLATAGVASRATLLPQRLLPLLWPSTVFNRLHRVRRGKPAYRTVGTVSGTRYYISYHDREWVLSRGSPGTPPFFLVRNSQADRPFDDSEEPWMHLNTETGSYTATPGLHIRCASVVIECPAGQGVSTALRAATGAAMNGEGPALPMLAALKCAPCTAGRWSRGGTNVPCRTCQGGHYSGHGAQGCKPCPAGRFGRSGSHRSLCDGHCARGQFSAAGARACTNCAQGRYLQSTGATRETDCKLCAAGRFGRGASKTSRCSGSCLPGRFARTGSNACASCAAGYYQPRRSAGACLSCPIGQFAPFIFAGRTACEACPHGRTTQKNATSSLKLCVYPATPVPTPQFDYGWASIPADLLPVSPEKSQTARDSLTATSNVHRESDNVESTTNLQDLLLPAAVAPRSARYRIHRSCPLAGMGHSKSLSICSHCPWLEICNADDD